MVLYEKVWYMESTNDIFTSANFTHVGLGKGPYSHCTSKCIKSSEINIKSPPPLKKRLQ